MKWALSELIKESQAGPKGTDSHQGMMDPGVGKKHCRWTTEINQDVLRELQWNQQLTGSGRGF